MTLVIFSWILLLITFTIYNAFICNSTDMVYIIKQGRKEDNEDGIIIFAYTALIAAIIIPNIPQID